MKLLLMSAVLLSSTALAAPMSAPQRMAPRPTPMWSVVTCSDSDSRNPGTSVSGAGQQTVSNHIIVQGGLTPGPRIGGSGDPAALGPKQDDPGPPPSPDLVALGPKQDDPGPPPSPDLVGCKKAPSH